MKTVDCLLIGHNEMEFVDYEEKVREMGTRSGAYRDLSLNFIKVGGKPYIASEVFNMVYETGRSGNHSKSLSLGETFGATISYLGSYLDRRGLTFDYVNSFSSEKEELAGKLEKENILTVAITTTLYVSVFPIFEIMEFIKKHNRSAKIVVGGPFVATQVRTLESAELTYLFRDIGADFYVDSAQGEGALVNIIKVLKNDLPLDEIDNIYYKKQGTYVKNSTRPENNRLSENMVDWNLFSDRGIEHANLRTAMSCPFSCSFCCFPEHAGKYQTADIEAVERELNRLNALPTVKSVLIVDDTFNIPMKRFKELLRMMVKNRYRFKWHCHFRCQFVDREVAELMQEAGCEGVFLGIESANNRVLKNMNKAVTVEQYLKGISILKEFDMIIHGSFIVGFPGETDKTLQDTVSFIKNSGIEFYRAQLWFCDPMSPIYKQKEQFGIENSRFEWSHATMDFRTACDWVDEIFHTVDEPVWVPQYNFEIDSVYHLMHRGIGKAQVKNFLRAFNRGIRERLSNPDRGKDASPEVLRELRRSLHPGEEKDHAPGNEKSPGDVVGKYSAGFDF